MVLHPKKASSSKNVYSLIGSVLGALVVMVCVGLFMWHKSKSSVNLNKTQQKSNTDHKTVLSIIPANPSKLFSYNDLKLSCKNFSDGSKLGEGGFGSVFKGVLVDGKEVALKRLSLNSQQGEQEFVNEVNVIKKVQHRNLIRLFGCCVEPERILVYEYLPNHSLDKHLFASGSNGLLGWHSRYEIISGVAQGLAYLHEGSPVRIVHRDIKASNILLDENFIPKIADFGLARLFVNNESHISTKVAGTFGYLAPEYALHGKLTEKADVFSFGILVLEVISGRRTINYNVPFGAETLLDLAWRVYEGNGEICDLVDPMIREECVVEELKRLVHMALLCVQESREQRPAMSSVVMMLSERSNDTQIPARPVWM